MTDIFSSQGWLCQTINAASDALWTYLLIAVLLCCAVWFTLRSRGVQFRMLGEMIRLLGDSATGSSGRESASGPSGLDSASGSSGRDSGTTGSDNGTIDPKSGAGKKHVSSFQAFAVSVATRVGTGNLAGVATAIAVGGPGAVFWMWLIALLGSATAFVESTLAQLYKKKAKDSFIGGPAYYIMQGLKMPWLSALFAILISVTFGLSYNSIQSNTICSAMDVAFGFDPKVVGIILTILSLAVIFGGIHRIAKVSSVIVPIMAIGYLVLALYVVLSNIGMIPSVIGMIVKDAFGITQIAGGGIGATMMNGIKRGLFSNEAGEGSAPNVAATATTSHPVKQGLIQALGVFTDTLVVCSCTAFIILFSGLDTTSGLNGIALTQAALEAEVGAFGKNFIAVAILLFAYSSIIGNYYYGEVNIRFLSSLRRNRRSPASSASRSQLSAGNGQISAENCQLNGQLSAGNAQVSAGNVRLSAENGQLSAGSSAPDGRTALTIYRFLSGGVMVIFGAFASLDLVWSIGDFFMALLTAVNLFAIVLLSKHVFRLLSDYTSQKRSGIKDPVFRRSQMPDLDIDCWE